MKKYKSRIILGFIVIAVLAAAFWWGGNAPGLQGWEIQSKQDVVNEANKKYVQQNEDNLANECVADAENNDDKINGDSNTDDNIDSDDKIDNSNNTKTGKPNTSSTDEQSSNQCTEKQNDSEDTDEDTSKDKSEDTSGNDNQGEDENKLGIESRPGGVDGEFTAEDKLEYAKKLAIESSEGVEKGDAEYSASQGMLIDKTTGKDKYLTDPVPEGKPVPVEPQDAVISDKELTCTLSVRCDTILTNIDWLDPEKVELVPEDGVIFATKKITFYEGESVFNVLLREMKKSKIHMEFVNTPIYNSAYIEGINNLYEFDCGELSGWMYKVNDWFPNYGCSRYQLKEGDKIEWVYTCNLGIDVGGYYSIGGE